MNQLQAVSDFIGFIATLCMVLPFFLNDALKQTRDALAQFKPKQKDARIVASDTVTAIDQHFYQWNNNPGLPII